MLIDRNAFESDRAPSVEDLRQKCVGCKDCSGPCLMLMQLSQLPDILLGLGEAQA